MSRLQDILATTLSPLLLSAGMAGSVVAQDLPAAPQAKDAPSCRLTVSKDTRSLYPAGYLELAARDCWAGSGADILVVGKDDIIKGDRNHMMPGKATIKEARQTLLNLMPADTRALFASIEPSQQEVILNTIVRASLSATNSSAMKYRFESGDGKPTKEVFITVVDDLYHVHDQMAAIAGVYLGSFINEEMYSADMDDKTSMRAMTFAHESGHGMRNDGLVVIRDGSVVLKGVNLRTPLERLEAETGADRHGHKNYASAIQNNIPLFTKTPVVDHALRALSAYFSYGPELEKGEEDYDVRYVKGYIKDPNPIPWHATSAGLNGDVQPDPKDQAEGARVFRQVMNGMLGTLFYDAATNQAYKLNDDIEKSFGSEIDSCAITADALPESARTPDAEAPLNAVTLVGTCIGHGIMSRGFAINALIELEDAHFTPENPYTKTYYSEFSEVVRAGALSDQFLRSSSLYYLHHQRENLVDPAVKARWDEFYIKRELLERTPEAAAPAPPR